ncbi:MAG: hypothetical protein GF317_19370 [Candidatus Lokiarchaeota archaeon]|nr:hypothetical protein [Candidatus Lokiarchaeota archaeon]MBD3201659.1 hypothetical protein [Candidatus Lokiarchaeota archaeon]
MNKKKEKDGDKTLNAKELAEIMVENMNANMADPEFLLRKERRMQEAAKEVLKEKEEILKNKKEKEEG